MIQKDLFESIDQSSPFFSYLFDTNTEEDDYLIFPVIKTRSASDWKNYNS